MQIIQTMSNVQLKDWLIIAVGAIGLVWYFLCILDMGLHPTKQGASGAGFRQFQSLSVTTISVSLATYVGYVIGLPAQAQAPGASSTVAAAAVASTSVAVLPPQAHVSPLQWTSAALYVASLVVAVYFYFRSKDDTEPAITGLAKSLLGFVAGVFSVALNLPS